MRKYSRFAYNWSRPPGTYQLFQFVGKAKDLKNAFRSILDK